MHPTGIEPALKASEASVLSIRLRVHKLYDDALINYYKLVTCITLTYISITFPGCPDHILEKIDFLDHFKN